MTMFGILIFNINYINNKIWTALWEKAYTDNSDIQTLLDSSRQGLASRYVRRKLIGEAHLFKTFEELRDMCHLRGQPS